MMKCKTLILICSLSLLGWQPLASAQDNNDEQQAVVLEDLSRSELRAEIEKYEDEFYRVFNASTEDDRLKVTCSDFLPTGSHIPQRSCEPKFVTDARARNVTDYQFGTSVLEDPEYLRELLGEDFEELTTAMNALLQENEYFQALNVDLRMLRARMQELEDA